MEEPVKPHRYFRVLAFLTLFVALSARATTEEGVTVTGTYLTDSDGYNYGMEFFLDSTVNETVCSYPRIASQDNVNGSVTPGPVLLKANESHFAIGSFISADHSKPWSVEVTTTSDRCR
jgi:hypothetical protein